jgi:uncharacterized membrane protein YgdD (TMEM256/DUF423 family)
MIRVAAGMGATAVAAGAFGAHALAARVTPERLATWHTASTYHLVHAVVLLALALSPVPRRLSGGLFTAGILLFSGSLYALVLLDQPWLGAVTPLGGLCFIAGWLSLARQPLIPESQAGRMPW